MNNTEELTKEEFSIKRQFLNYSEKLIFLIDSSNEIFSQWDSSRIRIESILQMIKIIVDRKLNNNIFNHEYCILIYNSYSKVQLLLNFSRSITLLSDFQSLKDQLNQFINNNNKINNETNAIEIELTEVGPDITLLFQNVDDLLSSLYPRSVSKINTNNFLYRCILIYSRTDQIPQFHPYTLKSTITSPFSFFSSFYLDIVFFHDKITTQTNVICENIYNQLNNIQLYYIRLFNSTFLNYYLFELSPSNVRLFTIASALTSHPFQRDSQINLNSKIEITVQSYDNLVASYEQELKELLGINISQSNPNNQSISTSTQISPPVTSPFFTSSNNNNSNNSNSNSHLVTTTQPLPPVPSNSLSTNNSSSSLNNLTNTNNNSSNPPSSPNSAPSPSVKFSSLTSNTAEKFKSIFR